MEQRRALVESGWLAGCPREFQDALLAHAQWRTWSRDQILWLAGDGPGGLIGIADGVVGLMTGLAEPGAPMGYVFRAGSWSGDNTILRGQPPLLTMIARTPVSGVVIGINHVTRLLDARPEWWRWIGTLSSINGLLATLLAADLMRPVSRERVAAVLLHITGIRSSIDAGPASTDGISQEDIAAMCGLTRNSIQRILAEFRLRGWISHSYRRVCVQAPEALHGLLGSDRP